MAQVCLTGRAQVLSIVPGHTLRLLMLLNIQVTDFTLQNLHKTVQPGLKLRSKACPLASIQRILVWKDHKDTNHFLMQNKISGTNAEVTFKVWLQAKCVHSNWASLVLYWTWWQSLSTHTPSEGKSHLHPVPVTEADMFHTLPQLMSDGQTSLWLMQVVLKDGPFRWLLEELGFGTLRDWAS